MNPPPPIVDSRTLDAARRGDRDAMAVLWRTYHPQMLRLLRARGTDSPDDIASQVWIDVGRSLASFEGDGVDFRRWLFTIARNRSNDEWRQKKRRSDAADRLESRALPDTNDDTETHTKASLDRALTILESLPPSQAEAVMLRVVFDMSVIDVAQIMDKSEGNVRVLVHRGLNTLQEMLQVDSSREIANAS